MISVPIDRIVPLTDARDNFSRLVADVENITDGMYVLTKGGKPAIALINIKYLEEIMAGNGPEFGHEHTHQASSPHHVSPKPHITPKPIEDAKPAPITHPDFPKPPAVKLPDLEPPKAPLPIKPSFEVPRIAPAPSSSAASTDVKPQNNYDVKPSVNPTWTGEEPKVESPVSSSPTDNQNQSSLPPILRPDTSIPEAIINKPLEADKAPSAPTAPVLPSEKPNLTPPVPSKPPINPWPIIPPRPSVSTPPLSSLSNSVGVNQPPSTPPPTPQPPVTPESNYPKMVAPPPPPPPSSLPRIPSSFQTVPVPVNGNKPPATPPVVTLPPPPVTTAPAPFAQAAPATPVVTSKPADAIPFDQPPTTIPDPGEDLPVPPATKTDTPAVSTAATPTATPPQSQASVQDLEI